MKVAISQPRYLPALNYLQRIVIADRFILLDDVQHQRRAFEHRNRLRDASGVHWLSIPVDRSHGSRPRIMDLVVVEPDWTEQHKRRLNAYYQGAPYFDPAVVNRLYDQVIGEARLVDIVERQLRWTLEYLGFEHQDKLVRSSSIPTDGSGSEHLANLTRAVGGTTYISGPNGRNYINAGDFGDISVLYHDFTFPTYTQRGDGFVPWLAWLDCLFQAGPEATRGYICERATLVDS